MPRHLFTAPTPSTRPLSPSPRGHSRAGRLALCLQLCLASLLSPSRQAQADAPPPATPSSTSPTSTRFDFAEKTLSNGLRVVAMEEWNAPVVQVQVWYHVGSKNESPDRQGFAHMFEHMMFRGTPAVPQGQFDQLLRKVGSDNNAQTNFDYTLYHEKVPANQLDLALYLEADRMASLTIDQNSFDTERAVVEEERRQGVNRPYGTVFERALAEIYTASPYRWTPIGKIPHLRKASVEELARFWEKYYVPNNATLVIVGAIKKDQALDMAEKYFGWIPRGDDVPRPSTEEPPQTAPKTIHLLEPRGQLPLIGLRYRTVPTADRDTTPLDVAMTILADGESSRLYRLLVKDKELAIEVGDASMSLEGAGLHGVDVTLNPEKLMAALQASGPQGAEAIGQQTAALLDTEIARLSTEDVPADELEKAKLKLLRSTVQGAQGVSNLASMLGMYATVYGDLSRVNSRFDEIAAVTPADIRRVAQKYLTQNNKNLILIEPARPGMELMKSTGVVEDDGPPAPKPATNVQPERRGPKATAVRPPSFPTTAPVAPLSAELPQTTTSEKTLANGLKVVVVPRTGVGQLPLVNLTIGIRTGAVSEPDASLGHASMAASMITQGTEHYDSKALAEELERHAITLGADIGNDAGAINASCLTTQTPDAMRLLAEVTLRPTFPQKEFDLVREQTLAGLQDQQANPKYSAETQLAAHLFPHHPYGRPPTGTPADVARVTRDGLGAWWNQYVSPNTCVLYIAGDVTPDKAFELADKYFADWKSPSNSAPAINPPAPQSLATNTTIYLLDRPGLVQSEIRVGELSINRHDSRWPIARVLSQIFGESFTSRLNDAIRVKKGLTYGVGGTIRPLRDSGYLLVDTFSKTQTTAATVQAVLDEIARMKTDAPTPNEIEGARNFMVGSLAGRRETAQDVVDDLWMIESNKLPKDYLEKIVQRAATVEPQEVQSLAQDLFNEKQLVIIVVGDAAQIRPALEKIAPVIDLKDPPQPAPSTEPITPPNK